ncbi:MAG: hydantoinase/oxoprolinase family protein [Chloroflexi bacterium]|nr:hydantoinase/oxoprolinase family protein [Chloroflexota bacterium]
MKLTLGIDAGGTYTDAILMDQVRGEVKYKAKALTTPHDLSLGISQAIEYLQEKGEPRKTSKIFQQIELISISTTLATNAVVEGHGGRVGLLLIGYDEDILQRNGFMNRLPVEGISFVPGGHDVKGEEVCSLDEKLAYQAILDLRDQVDAFAVSGYFSVMNPEHELRLRRMITELTSVPIVYGHELSSKLNALKRVSTVVLNARLLPVIQRLLDSVEQVLLARGIEAPLMMVKGDGSLINAKTARQRPVETILSGPAASAIGGQFLAGENSAIVVDMGGTTTDIAVLKDGQPWTNPAGATVGGWQTSIQAVDLRTIGLGGDSHIWVERDKTLHVGPQKAIPLCRLGEDWPEILRDLESALYSHEGEYGSRPTDFLVIIHSADGLPLTESEEALLQVLGDGPLTPSRLDSALKHYTVPSERLEALGIIRRAGLTPTDILWSESSKIGGNGSAARVGAQVVARQLGISVEELTQMVVSQVENKVAQEMLDKLVIDETGHSLLPIPNAWGHLLESALGSKPSGTVKCQIEVTHPIVAIGAPVGAFIPQVAKKLHTRCIIPPHAEVGNAVGAAVASVTHTVEVLVQPHILGAGTVEYLIHSPQSR